MALVFQLFDRAIRGVHNIEGCSQQRGEKLHFVEDTFRGNTGICALSPGIEISVYVVSLEQ